MAVFVSSFAQKLRDAGLAVDFGSVSRCADAIRTCPPSTTRQMYWVSRSCLVHDVDDFAVFDAVFAAVFDNEGLPIAPWDRDKPKGTVKMTGTMVRQSAPTNGFAIASQRMAVAQRPETESESVVDDPPDTDTELPELLPAELAHLADEPFDRLDNEDLDLIGTWMQEALRHFPLRPGRRWTAANRSTSVDMRRTIRRALATGAEPVRLARRRTKPRRRRVVMIADVSGSMESFARIYLHLMRGLVVHGDAEVFVFSTTPQRVTVSLRHGDPQAAIDKMTDDVADRFSGTRIAQSLHALIASATWSPMLRGSTVIVASDGWDTDAPEELGRQMERLARLTHRIIWVNPRAAAASFAPLAGGMAAALPHVDDFFSGHSLNGMRDVIRALSPGAS